MTHLVLLPCAFPSQRDCLICTVMSPVLWIVNTPPSDGNLKRFSNLLWTRPKFRNTIITCPNKIVALRCQTSQDSTRVSSNTLLSCFKTGDYPSLRPAPPPLFLDQTKARRAEKKNLFETAHRLCRGLDDRPPLPHLKVWFLHCTLYFAETLELLLDSIKVVILNYICFGTEIHNKRRTFCLSFVSLCSTWGTAPIKFGKILAPGAYMA